MADYHDCEETARRVAKEEIRLFRNAIITSFDDELKDRKKELKDLKDARNGFVGGFGKDLQSSNIFTINEIKIKDLEVKIDHLETIKKIIFNSSKFYQ